MVAVVAVVACVGFHRMSILLLLLLLHLQTSVNGGHKFTVVALEFVFVVVKSVVAVWLFSVV